MIIAIDGYSSCGKSTLAKDVASVLKFTYIDSGAMYRAVSLYCLQNEISFKEPEKIIEALAHIDITFSGRDNRTYLNGIDVENEIREPRISDIVSPVSAISEVRRFLVEQQRQLSKAGKVVMDGRDIGTVVFPNAVLKLFVTADYKERTRRRWEELQGKGIDISFEAVGQNLSSRDAYDSSRADSPLRQSDDAVIIDNTNLSRSEQAAMIIALAKLRMID